MSSAITTPELLAWLANAVVCAAILIRCYLRRDPMSLWSPEWFVGAIYVYYIVLGPMIAVLTDGTMDRGVDMQPYYFVGWIGSLLGLVSWAIGYQFARLKRSVSPRAGMVWTDDAGLSRLGNGLNFVGLLSYMATSGLSGFKTLGLAVDDPSLGGVTYDGAFNNYLGLSVNFLIAGCSVLFLARLRGRGSWAVFGGWIGIAVLIYTTLGFRYRLVLLVGALTFIFYLHRQRRPNLVLLAACATFFVAIMGLIGATRTYGAGLNLEKRSSFSDSFLSGFGEAGIFGTSGAVLTHVPEDRPFVWLEPIKQSLVMPVPSQLYRAKATNAYLVETVITIYGPTNYPGAAYMFFAEVYQMLSWPGIVLAHFGLGWFCRWLWVWYRQRQGDPLALIVYASTIPYLYVLFSRGYLPQVVMLFFFSVAPAIVLYRWPRFVMKAARGFQKPTHSQGVGKDPANAGPYIRILPPGVPLNFLDLPPRPRG